MTLNKKIKVSILISIMLIGPTTNIKPSISYADSSSSSVKKHTELSNKILKAEESFSNNSYFGDTKTKIINGTKVPQINNSTLDYKYIEGTTPILISAPHTVKQPPRPSSTSYKVSDKYTGGLAQYIAEKTGAHVIYKTAYNGVDDNYKAYSNKTDIRTPYRDKVESILKNNQINLVIDLHGYSDNTKEYGLEIGTNSSKNLLYIPELLNEIQNILNSNGFSKLGTKAASKSKSVHDIYAIDSYYKASYKNRTIANYTATTLNTPAIQIELSRSNRDPKIDENRVQKIADTLIEIINKSSSYLYGKTAKTTKDLNLKSTASNFSSTKIKIPKDKYFTVLSEYNSSWFKVKYENIIGYVPKSSINLMGQIWGVNIAAVFREKPSVNSRAIAHIQKNEVVNILGKHNNTWTKISYGGTVGYVATKFLKPVDVNTAKIDSISEIKYMDKKVVGNTINALYLRTGKTSSSEKIATVKKGESVSILEYTSSTIVKVAYKDKIGYLFSKHLV